MSSKDLCVLLDANVIQQGNLEMLECDFVRIGFGFHNPNHAAALFCALLPFCFGRQYLQGVWRGLVCCLFLALLLTQSRTGLLVAFVEFVVWGIMKERRTHPRFWCVLFVALVLASWWMAPRLVLDDSILNRPKIWFAGIQLFAENLCGVGLGNSGALVSALFLPDISPVRTLISAHLTLIVELGWVIGGVWLMFIVSALRGVHRLSRLGLAFAGLVLFGCTSTIFDWSILFDFADCGGFGRGNWILSWMLLIIFVGFGIRLIPVAFRCDISFGQMGKSVCCLICVFLFVMLVVGGVAVMSHNALPRVKNGFVYLGSAPYMLALYDEDWDLKTIMPYMRGSFAAPVHALSRFPRGKKLDRISCIVLFGNCCEWDYLVKGIPIKCVGD